MSIAGAIGVSSRMGSEVSDVSYGVGPFLDGVLSFWPTLTVVGATAAWYLNRTTRRIAPGDRAAGYTTLAVVMPVRASAALRAVGIVAIGIGAHQLGLLPDRSRGRRWRSLPRSAWSTTIGPMLREHRRSCAPCLPICGRRLNPRHARSCHAARPLGHDRAARAAWSAPRFAARTIRSVEMARYEASSPKLASPACLRVLIARMASAKLSSGAFRAWSSVQQLLRFGERDGVANRCPQKPHRALRVALPLVGRRSGCHGRGHRDRHEAGVRSDRSTGTS